MCFGAKWLGRPDDEIIFDSEWDGGKKRMVKHLHSLYSDADVVVGYNSISFDTKVVNKEFVMAGLPPPPPFKQIDLLRTMRQNFRFASNKLDFVSQQLGLGGKTHHMGHALWSLCETGDPDARALMSKYNRQDVLLTEKLYHRVLPWIKGLNVNSFTEQGGRQCPHCGSTHLQARGFARTVAQRYQRYQCVACGTWTKDAFALNTRGDRANIMREA